MGLKSNTPRSIPTYLYPSNILNIYMCVQLLPVPAHEVVERVKLETVRDGATQIQAQRKKTPQSWCYHLRDCCKQAGLPPTAVFLRNLPLVLSGKRTRCIGQQLSDRLQICMQNKSDQQPQPIKNKNRSCFSSSAFHRQAAHLSQQPTELFILQNGKEA